MHSLRGRKASRATADQLDQFKLSRQSQSLYTPPLSTGFNVDKNEYNGNGGNGYSYGYDTESLWSMLANFHVHHIMPGIKAFLRQTHIHVLLFAWLFIIYWGERYYPYHELQKCKWHGDTFDLTSPSVARVALVADPQLVDDNTYPSRNKGLLSVTKYIVDGYLRRNWVNMHEVLDPDATIFLGDLFDGGREWNDSVWIKEFDRWNRIFTKPANKRTVMSLPGNHDIGFGDTLVPSALERFRAFFGPTSSTLDIANHTFVLLDTISMISELNASIYTPPRQFLDSVPDHYPSHPRFLLTHIPLYRDKNADCGIERESSHKSLSYVRGYQYQTLIPPDVSTRILNKVNPALVFSGDDHDACHVKHVYKNSDTGNTLSTDEYTVKSFSMAMGISRPGIQLITLDGSRVSSGSGTGSGSTTSSTSYKTSLCLLPSPFKAFLVYIFWALVSLALIVAVGRYPHKFPRGPAKWLLPRSTSTSASSASTSQSPTLPIAMTFNPDPSSSLRRQSAFTSWKHLVLQAAFVGLWILMLFMFQHRRLFNVHVN